MGCANRKKRPPECYYIYQQRPCSCTVDPCAYHRRIMPQRSEQCPPPNCHIVTEMILPNANAGGASSSAKPIPGSSKKPNQVFSPFEKACLQEHNILRSKHNCPPLELTRELCEYAREWARILLKRNVMEHRTETPYGENIYTSTGMGVDARRPVHVWYAEIKDYNFEKGDFSPAVGHFTQVLWKSSEFLGVAYAEKEETVYVVANYDPPGNYIGQFVENVPPPVVL